MSLTQQQWVSHAYSNRKKDSISPHDMNSSIHGKIKAAHTQVCKNMATKYKPKYKNWLLDKGNSVEMSPLLTSTKWNGVR